MWWMMMGAALAADFGVEVELPECKQVPAVKRTARCAGDVCIGQSFAEVEAILGACDDPRVSADLVLKTDELKERSLRCSWSDQGFAIAVRGGAVASLFVYAPHNIDGLTAGDSLTCAVEALGEPDRVDLRKRDKGWTIDTARFGPLWVTDRDGDGRIDKIVLHGR